MFVASTVDDPAGFVVTAGAPAGGAGGAATFGAPTVRAPVVAVGVALDLGGFAAIVGHVMIVGPAVFTGFPDTETIVGSGLEADGALAIATVGAAAGVAPKLRRTLRSMTLRSGIGCDLRITATPSAAETRLSSRN